MQSKIEILLVSQSNESSPSFPTTSETLKKFQVPHRHVTPTSSASSESVFCLIIKSQADCIEWANRLYPNTPKLLVSPAQEGADALESVIQTAQQPVPNAMPTFAIGKAGETNAALFAVSVLATQNRNIRKKLLQFRKDQTQAVLKNPIPGE